MPGNHEGPFDPGAFLAALADAVVAGYFVNNPLPAAGKTLLGAVLAAGLNALALAGNDDNEAKRKAAERRARDERIENIMLIERLRREARRAPTPIARKVLREEADKLAALLQAEAAAEGDSLLGAAAPGRAKYAGLSWEARFLIALDRAVRRGAITEDLAAKLEEMVEPGNLAATLGLFAALAGAHHVAATTGNPYAVAAVGVLDHALLAKYGRDTLLAIWEIYLVVDTLEDEQDLDAVARQLSQQISGPIVAALASLVTAAGGKFLGKAYCFPAGTPVATAQGLRPIEEVKVGDRLWACDLTTGEWALQPVRETLRRTYAGTMVTLRILPLDGPTKDEPATTLEATADHPFWVVMGSDLDNRPAPRHVPPNEASEQLLGRWVDAGDLLDGDCFLTRWNDYVVVLRATQRSDTLEVFNAHITDWHTFAVGMYCVLVHNTRSVNGRPASRAQVEELLESGAVTARKSTLQQAEQLSVNRQKAKVWELEIERRLRSNPKVASVETQVPTKIRTNGRKVDFEVEMRSGRKFRVEAKSGNSRNRLQEAWDRLFEQLTGRKTYIAREH